MAPTVIWSARQQGGDGSKNALPKIYITEQVIEKMCQGALLFPDEENGEAMIGLMMNGEDKLPDGYILNTIPAVEGEAQRHWAFFEHGDETQWQIFQWWSDGWTYYRQRRAASYGRAVAGKWNAPLLYLGDWHKQPSGMIAPSLGDLRTARSILREMNQDQTREYLLAPIVTFADEAEDEPEANTLIIETSVRPVRIDFWGLRRKGGTFLPFEPIVQPDADLPRLPPLTWWLLSYERYQRELDALEAHGLKIMDIVTWHTQTRSPLDTNFVIHRTGSSVLFIAMTTINYPEVAPRWRVAPLRRPKEGHDLFTELFQVSHEVPEKSLPTWNSSLLLRDVINHIESVEKL
jgi:hypothetical protein